MTHVSARRVTAALMIAGPLQLSCGSEPPPEKPPVILITIDTLRADRLGCYGYFRETSPFLDLFAEEAILFENVIAPMATTLPSHLSLLTSTHPLRHGILSNVDYFKQAFEGEGRIRTAAQMFSDIGYETAAFVSASPLRALTGISIGFETFNEPDSTQRIAQETTDAVLEWLDRERDRPLFLWVHYFDPHDPYASPFPYSEFFLADDELDRYLTERRFLGGEHAAGVRQIQDHYDGEVRYTDYQIGRLFAGLKERGIWDDAAVAVTADHGEGLGQHGVWVHGVIHNEQIRIPLIVKLPGMTRADSRRETGLVALLDVLPMLVEELRLPVSDGDRRQFGGTNPLDGAAREYALSVRSLRRDKFGTTRKFSLTSSGWKYSLRTDAPDELFDLRRDPHELTNVIESNPEIAAEHRERIMARIEGEYRMRNIARGESYRARADSQIPERASAEHLEELRALGYVD
jgi:arylsulfatase